jgi:hypothetical protein
MTTFFLMLALISIPFTIWGMVRATRGVDFASIHNDTGRLLLSGTVRLVVIALATATVSYFFLVMAGATYSGPLL